MAFCIRGIKLRPAVANDRGPVAAMTRRAPGLAAADSPSSRAGTVRPWAACGTGGPPVAAPRKPDRPPSYGKPTSRSTVSPNSGPSVARHDRHLVLGGGWRRVLDDQARGGGVVRVPVLPLRRPGDPLVIRREVPLKDVLLYTDERDEAEAVVLKPGPAEV